MGAGQPFDAVVFVRRTADPRLIITLDAEERLQLYASGRRFLGTVRVLSVVHAQGGRRSDVQLARVVGADDVVGMS